VAADEVEERILLLSIQPRFTAAIISGEKTVELRRSRMQATPGSQVLLYSSSPVKAVVATAVLERIDSNGPEELWSISGAVTAVTKAEFDEYFAGAKNAYGLHLRNVTSLTEPISLRALRDSLGVEPPQSFRYLTRAQVDSLLPRMVPSSRATPLSPSEAPTFVCGQARSLLRVLNALASSVPSRRSHSTPS
jgi:predicted transcriptional regulator